MSTFAQKSMVISPMQKNIGSDFLMQVKEGNQWIPFQEKMNSLAPNSHFKARIYFRVQAPQCVFWEWPDNKIEKIKASVVNSEGKSIGNFSFDDAEGFTSNFYVKNQVFKTPILDSNKMYVLYYEIYSHNTTYPMVWGHTDVGFMQRFQGEVTWYGWLAGVVVAVFFLNIFLFVQSKDKPFLIYALYALSLGLYHWAYTGMAFEWLWPWASVWNRYAYMVFSFLVMNMQWLYFYFYLNIATNKLWKYIKIFIVANTLLLFCTILFPEVSWILPLVDWLGLSFLIIGIVYSKVLHYWHGRMYMASVVVLWMGYFVFILSYYQWIPSNFFTYNAVALGGVLEILIGMFALALRYKQMIALQNEMKNKEIVQLKENAALQERLLFETQEKERIQAEINIALEIKVQERTLELMEQKSLLEQMNVRLQEMSSQLDKQNFKLTKTLETSSVQMMWGKKVDYEEFVRIFPSENHVIRFVADLKWEEGYTCVKCGHDNYVKGNQHLSRKCSKCKYEESATANTLFHGVRFSLVKALYLSLDTVMH